MNQKELAEKARTMQRDYSNSEIAEILRVRLEDLNSALVYGDSAVKVPIIGDESTAEKEDKPKQRPKRKKS